MYEKIVGHFESELCMNNIYFRKKYKTWIIGIICMFVFEVLTNHLMFSLVTDLWMRIITVFIIDFLITTLFFILIYVLPIKNIYKNKIKMKTIIDPIGLLMNEERLSAYREIEIKEMEYFLRKECKITSTESIHIIINLINDEIKDKYERKNFIEKYFNATILPVLILILTVYFTNNNEQQFINILAITIIAIVTIIVAGNFVIKIKDINITPVNRRENLVELKRVLMDILIKWNNDEVDR